VRVGGESAFRIESSSAGPFVTVLSLVGPMDNGARAELQARLGDPDLASRRLVVDLTKATLDDPWPLALLAESSARFRTHGGELVLVSDGSGSLPGVHSYTSLDDAMVELLRDVTKLGEWPPPAPA
jgi:hypothetical protein